MLHLGQTAIAGSTVVAQRAHLVNFPQIGAHSFHMASDSFRVGIFVFKHHQRCRMSPPSMFLWARMGLFAFLLWAAPFNKVLS